MASFVTKKKVGLDFVSLKNASLAYCAEKVYRKYSYGRVVKAVCRIIGVPDIPMGPEMILCVSIL